MGINLKVIGKMKWMWNRKRKTILLSPILKFTPHLHIWIKRRVIKCWQNINEEKDNDALYMLNTECKVLGKRLSRPREGHC